ncbi:hypothetical protein VNI00_003994 [Paramarasmius palmivorus]|uniref:Mei2-like C-terminal RNA recognition motif domain-containing protein n=1 Tax=Paramarasmius palmivorus TaxID=297713 RepID=A0AAW0DNT8_9AGAR
MSRSPSPSPRPPSRPSRLQHSPSLPNIWLPPHSGPLPSEMNVELDRTDFHRIPDVAPPADPNDRHDDSNSISKRRQEFSAAFNNAIRQSNERQLRENSEPFESSNVARPSVKARRGAQRLAAAEPQPNTPLLTPPLTPSSSLRTVSSVESSPVDATGPTENVSVNHYTTTLPKNSSRLLLIKNISISPSDLQEKFRRAFEDSFSPASTTLVDPRPLLCGIFTRRISEGVIVVVALHDIRDAVRAKQSLSNAVPSALGEFIAEGEQLLCDFISIEELKKEMGPVVNSIEPCFYVAATRVDRPSDSPMAGPVFRFFSRRGELLRFERVSNDTITVESDAEVYRLEYFDIRDSGDMSALNGMRYLGIKLQIFRIGPVSQDTTPQASTPVPAGQASHIRRRFMFPVDGSASAATMPSSVERSDSPAVFYNSSAAEEAASRSLAPNNGGVPNAADPPAAPVAGPEVAHAPLGPLQQFFSPQNHPQPDPGYTFPPAPVHPLEHVPSPPHPMPMSPHYPASPPPFAGSGPQPPQFMGLPAFYDAQALYEYNQMYYHQHQMIPNGPMYPIQPQLNYQGVYPPPSPPQVPFFPAPVQQRGFIGHGPPTPPTEYWVPAAQFQNGIPFDYQQGPIAGAAGPCIDIDQGPYFVEPPAPVPPHSPPTSLSSPTTDRSSSPSQSSKVNSPVREVQKGNQLDLVKIEEGLDTRTTVMIKNIPNKMSIKDLETFINKVCPRRIDFLYLRMDFKNGCNFGYAFVNFITVQDLLFFAKMRLNLKWNMFSSEKVLQMSYANYQGKEALIEKFKNSSIMDEREEWRPKIYYSELGPEQGLPEPFPAPTHYKRKERSSHNRGALYGSGSVSVGSVAELGPMLRQGPRHSPHPRKRGGGAGSRGRGGHHAHNPSMGEGIQA